MEVPLYGSSIPILLMGYLIIIPRYYILYCRMFVQPLYCGVLFDQCMLLNRRKHDAEDMKGVDEKVRMKPSEREWTQFQ